MQGARARMDGPDHAGRGRESLPPCWARLNTLPKPLIGRVQGNAFWRRCWHGASVCACGDRVGYAKMAYRDAAGIIPATIGPYVCAKGEGGRRAVFIGPVCFDAGPRGQFIRLACRVANGNDLDGAIEAEVCALSVCAAGGCRLAAKQLQRDLGPADSTLRSWSIPSRHWRGRWETEEAARNIGAFF